MPIKKILVDSSYLYSLFDENDKDHKRAVAAATLRKGQFLIPYVILTEVAYLFNREGGVPAVLKFFDKLLKMQPELQDVTFADLSRARDIMAQYADARLDFVDCCLMALAERLNVTQICTFDRRDFEIFRPKHTTTLDILP
jgi:uncharacterized protein